MCDQTPAGRLIEDDFCPLPDFDVLELLLELRQHTLVPLLQACDTPRSSQHPGQQSHATTCAQMRSGSSGAPRMRTFLSSGFSLSFSAAINLSRVRRSVCTTSRRDLSNRLLVMTSACIISMHHHTTGIVADPVAVSYAYHRTVARSLPVPRRNRRGDGAALSSLQ
jgi:hypothetical protein